MQDAVGVGVGKTRDRGEEDAATSRDEIRLPTEAGLLDAKGSICADEEPNASTDDQTAKPTGLPTDTETGRKAVLVGIVNGALAGCGKVDAALGIECRSREKRAGAGGVVCCRSIANACLDCRVKTRR